MRLNAKLRRELLRSVILDQCKQEAEALKNNLKKTVEESLQEKYGDFDKDLRALYAKYGKKPSDIRMNRAMAITTGDYNKRRADSHRFSINPLSTSVDSWRWEVLFKFDTYFDVPTFCYDYYPDVLDVMKNDALYEALEEVKAFVKRTEELQDDLISVLCSCTTVKKLQEVTKVFDPFIPAEKKGTNMIPAEPLCRINKLKSPKVSV